MCVLPPLASPCYPVPTAHSNLRRGRVSILNPLSNSNIEVPELLEFVFAILAPLELRRVLPDLHVAFPRVVPLIGPLGRIGSFCYTFKQPDVAARLAPFSSCPTVVATGNWKFPG